MTEHEGSYLFLTGADMDPTEVRRAYPNAQFVARGFTEARAGEIAPAFKDLLAGPGVGDVWGILIRVPEPAGENVPRHDVTTDDGRTFNAVVAGEQMVAGLPNFVLAAARYWELPPAYTGRLEMATLPLGTIGADDKE